MYVFILQQENNTQNIMPEGQQGAYSLLPQQKMPRTNIYATITI